MKCFKKIYVEITNRCNLKCSFCDSSDRQLHDMTPLEFENVIDKIKDYTDYIYLHVKGEPLLSCYLDSILDICDRRNIKVNITTNGVFIKEKYLVLASHSSIRQINVSLHCEQSFPDYFDNIFNYCSILSKKMFISYRIWNLSNFKLDDKSTKIVEKIISFYKLSPDIVEKIYKANSVKLDNNTYLNKENLFVWPDKSRGGKIDGFCYGLTTHVGILCDGTVVPCCLDGKGDIPLGNIFESNFEEIINSNKARELKEGFRDNKSVDELCKNCNFRNRFLKNMI